MKKQFRKIYIEITNICNLNCNFCPKTKRKNEFMSLELFSKAIREAKPLCDEITLHIMGEPLIHPQINEIVKLAEQEDVKINLTTNATLIKNNETILLNKTIRRINFSIHGIKANYNEEEQKKFITKINEFTKRAQKEREDLIITYRLWNVDKEGNEKILEQINEEFITALETKNNKISTKIRNNAFIHYDESFEWPSPLNPIRTNRGFCQGLSSHIGILVDGTIVPCCLDNDGNIPLGNIKEDSIVNILNKPRAKNMKKGFQDRKLVEDLCKRCTYIKRFEKGRDK